MLEDLRVCDQCINDEMEGKEIAARPKPKQSKLCFNR